MPTDDERIATLERELAELKAKTDRPLTLAEIRKLSPEEAQARWEQVKRSLPAQERKEEDDGEPPSPRERIRRGLEADARARESGARTQDEINSYLRHEREAGNDD